MNNNLGARLLFACHDLRRQMRRSLSQGDLTQGEFLALRFISNSASKEGKHMEGIRAALLSDTLEMSRPAVSRILGGLENRGLITRGIDPNDRRGISLCITEKGAAELQNAAEGSRKKSALIIERLGEQDAEKLIELLGKLCDILRDTADE